MNAAWGCMMGINWHLYPTSVYPYMRMSAHNAAVGIPLHWEWPEWRKQDNTQEQIQPSGIVAKFVREIEKLMDTLRWQ